MGFFKGRDGAVAWRRASLRMAACLAVTVAAAGARGDTPGADPSGTSSRAAYREALDAIPFERLPAPQAELVRRCLRSTTLYRRLPAQTFTCDGDLLHFSIDHPEAIVDLWRVLDISKLSLDPCGPNQWRLADGYGTVGMLRLLHRERTAAAGTMLLVGRGAYTGPLAPKQLTGSCLILLRHGPAAASPEGRPRQSVVIDAFLDVDGFGLELVARTLQPLIVRSAAWNAREICSFVSELSNACEENPEGVARLAARLSRIEEPLRGRLAAIAKNAGRKSGVVAASGADAERLPLELASRWLPAEKLPEVK